MTGPTGERVAVFPGSFDPFTRGHESVLRRALQLFDRIVVGVGVNAEKHTPDDGLRRAEALARLFRDEPRVEVEAYEGLTVDFASRHGARFILRGIRSVKDYEYEVHMADLNRKLAGVETVILFSDPEWAAVSSSVVRELRHYGKDVAPYLPEGLEYE